MINGKSACTGALINNTLSDKTPYFLTAHHSMRNDEAAKKSVFYFNYESPSCDGPDGQNYQIVSGARMKATSTNLDFSLLQLNAGVPSSYQPFFAGWDKSGDNSNSAFVIHHPRGNVKKISFEDDPIVPNPVTRHFQDFELAPGTAWDVVLDIGTTESGSSGGPLFNSFGRIIGQNSGGDPGCPGENGILKHYGRLSISWNNGTANTERLRDWLDPNNNASNVMRGYAPQGWLNDWVTEWNAPSSQNVHVAIKAISVGAGNQVFYRGADNKMHTMYWSNGDWVHDWINGLNASATEDVQGDVVTDPGNQIFYRGVDAKMHVYYWSNNDWHHGWIGGSNAPSNQNIHSAAGSIAVGENQIFYRGTDNKMHVYFWSNGSWHHDWVNGANASATESIAGDVVVIEGNQIVYRGTDGKMHVYYLSNNQWQHGWLGGWNAPLYQNISSSPGSIATGGGQVFYRGTDNKMHVYYWSNGSWYHGWLGGWNASSVENVSGDISVSYDGQVAYRGADGKMHIYYWANTAWEHNWIETSWQAPSINNVSGSIDISPSSQVFYRGNDGRCRVYYWETGFFRSSQANDNYSMYETKPSPTIPGSDQTQEFELFAYPNPLNEELNIRVFGNEPGAYTVLIFDITGNLMMSEEMNDFKVKVLNLNENLSGIYVLKVTDSNGNVVTKKIIKQ